MTFKTIASLTMCMTAIASHSNETITSYEKKVIQPQVTPMVLAISTAVYEQYNTDTEPQINQTELMTALVDLNKIFPKPPHMQRSQGGRKVDQNRKNPNRNPNEGSQPTQMIRRPPQDQAPNIKGIGSGLMYHFDKDHNNLLSQSELTELFTHLGTRLPLNKKG